MKNKWLATLYQRGDVAAAVYINGLALQNLSKKESSLSLCLYNIYELSGKSYCIYEYGTTNLDFQKINIVSKHCSCIINVYIAEV